MPTQQTLAVNILNGIAAFVYIAGVVCCIVFLIYNAWYLITDWIKRKKAEKLLREEPVEWILDCPGYAVGEFYPEKKSKS